MSLAFFGLGSTELLIIAGVLVLLFGGSQLPKVARALGQSVLELRRGTRELRRLDCKDDDDARP
jgi:sec-independent protein translocase protein TatA